MIDRNCGLGDVSVSLFLKGECQIEPVVSDERGTYYLTLRKTAN